MTNSRYINDMIIRYYALTKTIREITEDGENFWPSEHREILVNHLVRERTSIKNMLDMDLADDLGRATSQARVSD